MPRSLFEGTEAMLIRRSPNGAGHTRPQPGRDRSEQVVAINRNAWSQSIGTGGRNHPERACGDCDLYLLRRLVRVRRFCIQRFFSPGRRDIALSLAWMSTSVLCFEAHVCFLLMDFRAKISLYVPPISAIRNLLGFSDYRYRSVDFLKS
jgi:hypothetical protein